MHCGLLGVTKLLLSLWTDAGRSAGTCHNLRADVNDLNQLIEKIQTPSIMRRKPRGLTNLKHWKGELFYLITQFYCHFYFLASEYRSWVLFYSIPVLHGSL